MSDPKDHLSFQWAELHKLESQYTMMKRWGVSFSDPGYIRLGKAVGEALAKVGVVKPRLVPLILRIAGLSPGEIRLFADAELGWKTEARTKPGATPVYKYVKDEVAEKIIKGQLTHELEDWLMTPDDYIGE